ALVRGKGRLRVMDPGRSTFRHSDAAVGSGRENHREPQLAGFAGPGFTSALSAVRSDPALIKGSVLTRGIPGLLACGLLLVCGCGLSEYEQLVTKRIAELKASTAVGPITWRRLSSATGFYSQWPQEAQLISTAGENSTTEQLDATEGPIRFQAVFVTSSNPVNIDDLATTQEQNLQGQSFMMNGRTTGEANGLAFVEMNFLKLDESGQTRMRIYQLAPEQTCILSVTGKVLDDPQLAEFLASVKRQ
ncbi:MAG TPA: hypothetical protein VIY86_03450, partial [Pirellulaceae bacterium]